MKQLAINGLAVLFFIAIGVGGSVLALLNLGTQNHQLVSLGIALAVVATMGMVLALVRLLVSLEQ